MIVFRNNFFARNTRLFPSVIQNDRTLVLFHTIKKGVAVNYRNAQKI